MRQAQPELRHAATFPPFPRRIDRIGRRFGVALQLEDVVAVPGEHDAKLQPHDAATHDPHRAMALPPTAWNLDGPRLSQTVILPLPRRLGRYEEMQTCEASPDQGSALGLCSRNAVSRFQYLVNRRRNAPTVGHVANRVF